MFSDKNNKTIFWNSLKHFLWFCTWKLTAWNKSISLSILLQCDYCSQGHSNNENQSQCRMGAKYSNSICNLSQLCQVQNNTITSTCSLTRILNSRFPLQYNFNLFACDEFKISFQFLPYWNQGFTHWILAV